MIRDNKMLIDIHENVSNVSNEFDELIEKLEEMEKPRVRLIINLGKKVIEINGETDLKQDYFSKLTRFQYTRCLGAITRFSF